MATVKSVVKGVLTFFVGVFFTMISYWIVPVFIENLPTTTLKTIFWAGLIVLWILAVVVAPVSIIMSDEA